VGDHYYLPDGSEFHTIKGKNGKLRATTIRDVRAAGAHPSVTTIGNIIDKPGLHRAKNGLVAEEMFKMFFEADADILEGDIDYMKGEAIRRANEHWEKAANTGTIIHDAIESSFADASKFNPEQEVWLPKLEKSTRVGNYVEVVNEWLLDNKIEIDQCEVTCVNKEYGYAGKTDIVATYKGEQIIIDWKTTKTKEKDRAKDLPWDSHCQQIAAYSKCLWNDLPSFGVNVYLSTTEIDPRPRLEAVWWTREQMAVAFETFIATFKAWQKIKKYNPISTNT